MSKKIGWTLLILGVVAFAFVGLTNLAGRVLDFTRGDDVSVRIVDGRGERIVIEQPIVEERVVVDEQVVVDERVIIGESGRFDRLPETFFRGRDRGMGLFDLVFYLIRGVVNLLAIGLILIGVYLLLRKRDQVEGKAAAE